MSIYWTNERVDVVLQVLSEHDTLSCALEALGTALGKSVTYESIRGVLRNRLGNGDVTSFLKGGKLVQPSIVEQRDGDEDAEQIIFQDEADDEREVVVDGIMPDSKVDSKDPEKLWDRVIADQVDREKRTEKRYSQVIKIGDQKPILLAMFSDLHIGDPYADYKQMLHDAKLVRDTDGAHALSAGDHHNNWLGKLAHLQRGHNMDFDSELVLMRSWFDILGDKLLVVVPGNHDIWSKREAGFDLTKEMLRGAKLLYDADEVVFTLAVHGKELVFKVRHKWKWKSIFNPTHGSERIERSDSEYDVAVGGHTHVGTLFREFYFHRRKRVACLIGSYKFHDRFAVQNNFTRSVGSGCGALMLHPDGEIQPWTNLDRAVEYLRYLRAK